MNVHISYKVPKNSFLENEINLHVAKLGKRLQVFKPELVHLRGVLEENVNREGCVVSLDLKLPSGNLAARESGHGFPAAIKSVFDDLLEQVGKHKDQLRHEYKWIRRRKDGQKIIPQVPFEHTLAAVQLPKISADDIASYINANLPRLQLFVQRELRYRENAQQLRPGQVIAEEVIDEAIARALDDSLERPEPLGLEPWIYRLSIRAMDSLAVAPPEEATSVPLEHWVRKETMNTTSDATKDEVRLQYHQPDEGMSNNDLIADSRMATPEAAAASDEMMTQVEDALLEARPEDRAAFLLYAVEGFSPEEIAAIGDRSPADVRKSITSAREHLRTTLSGPNEFRDKLLQHSKIA